MLCPFCNKVVNVPNQALMNIEFYGDNSFPIFHDKCGHVVKVHMVRKVEVIDITKTDMLPSEAEWNNT